MAFYSGFLPALLFTLTASADPIIDSVQEPYGSFGHLGNIAGRCGLGGLCAPTATVNSFQYLVNTFVQTYAGTSIITQNNLALTRDMLAGGWFAPTGNPPAHRPGTGDEGATMQDWWQGKVQWISDFAPATTNFAGMVNQDTSTWLMGSLLTDTVPTFDFLWNELTDREDVELQITFGGTVFPGGHAITLTGLTRVPGPNGARTITYLDPNTPGGTITAPLITNADGSLGFFWNNGNNPPKDVTIAGAFAESPLPEPSSFVLLATALVLGGFKKRLGLNERR
jgi:hypothetical protein